MVKIAFCQATYNRDFEETKKCIERVSKYTDYTIISYDNSLDQKQIGWLNDNQDLYHIQQVPYVWKDNMPDMRNSYLDKAYELGIDWCCVSDPDELYSIELCENLRNLIEEYDKQGYNRIGVPCVDHFTNIEWLDNLDMTKESPGGYHETSFWKPILIFKISGTFEQRIRYAGIGKEKNVHETLIGGGRIKSINIDKKYNYVHNKSALKIWRNAARNMWISGGGDNVGSLNPLWRGGIGDKPVDALFNSSEKIMGIRDICDILGINTWNKFEEFIMMGQDKFLEKLTYITKTDNNIVITKETLESALQEFDKWLIAALQSGSNPWQTETRECAKWYYAMNRGDVDDLVIDLIEKPPKIIEESELENFVSKAYFKILGRHPDAAGKENYIKLIKEGKIKREDLDDIFKKSDEYTTKFPFGRMDEYTECDNKYKYHVPTSSPVSSILSEPVLSPSLISQSYPPKLQSSSYQSSPPFLIAHNATDSEIEKFVQDTYLSILGREADIPGKITYIGHIKSGKVKPHELESILKNSSEYRMKQIDSSIDNNIIYKNDLTKTELSRSNLTRTEIMKNDSPFKRQERKILRRQDTVFDLDNIDISKYNSVALCIMGYSAGIDMIKESIKNIGTNVDEIHIQGDDFIDSDIKNLINLGKEIDREIDIHIVPWKDNFSDYKNRAMGWASTEWVLILDHDEIPTIDMSKRLKEIILKSDRGNNFDMVSFDVRDIITDNNIIIQETRNKGGKALLHWRIPEPYTGDVHIWLKNDYYPWKVIHAPVAYKHVKDVHEILERSARNIWMGGGGDTVKGQNELWIELRHISDELGLKTWSSFHQYLKTGKIDNRLIDIFVRLSKKQWKDEELKDLKKYYLKLHPEENNRMDSL